MFKKLNIEGGLDTAPQKVAIIKRKGRIIGSPVHDYVWMGYAYMIGYDVMK
jgi:hypothetical protein